MVRITDTSTDPKIEHEQVAQVPEQQRDADDDDGDDQPLDEGPMADWLAAHPRLLSAPNGGTFALFRRCFGNELK